MEKLHRRDEGNVDIMGGQEMIDRMS